MGKLKGTTTKAKFRYWVKEPKKRKRPVSLFCKPFGPALKPNANSHIVTGGSMGGDLTATSPKIRSTSNVTSSFGDRQVLQRHHQVELIWTLTQCHQIQSRINCTTHTGIIASVRPFKCSKTPTRVQQRA
ncbi:uncharacterized protein LOC143465445 isoform X1 [Clavelina lepadiformis]|uniref:uncharacterized protein LOC143465445 isoform X1 n=1 Tax=Clavelina lepadiformis TaxID=159417 RepID=UPI004041DA3A